MDAQVFHAAVHQQGTHRVGHATDSDLKTRPILNLGGDLPGHRAVNLARLRIRQLRAGQVISFDDVIDLAQVHGVFLAEDVGDLAVDLDDDHLGAFDHRSLPKTRGAEVEIAAVVHRASLENGDIDGIEKAPVI